MEMESLRLFCDMADAGNFSEAARKNDVNRKRVSSNLKALERHLSTRLVERRQRQNRLTLAGQVLYSHAKGMLQAYDASQAALREMRGEPPLLPVTPPARLAAVPPAYLAATLNPQHPTNPPAPPQTYSI
jgi:DNA-binding transcriptional LysR family regulator